MILNIIYLNSLKTLKCSCPLWTSPPNSKVIYPTAHSTPSLGCLTVSSNLTQGPALPSAFSILVNGKPILWAAQTQNMAHDFPSCSLHTPQGIHQKILLAVFSKYIQNLTTSYYIYQYYRSRPPWLLASHQCNCLLIAFLPLQSRQSIFFPSWVISWLTKLTLYQVLYTVIYVHHLFSKYILPKCAVCIFQVKVVKWNSLSRITLLFFERAGPKHLKSQALSFNPVADE